METPETRISRVKQFVEKHKVAITVVATSTVWFALQRHAVRQHDEFLRERGLLDEYYTPEDWRPPQSLRPPQGF